MLNKTASSGIPSFMTSRRLESGVHDSEAVIQKLLHNTCHCPGAMTLESALMGLTDEVRELLNEAYPLRSSSVLFFLLTYTCSIAEVIRLQHDYCGSADYDVLVDALGNLESALTIMSELNYQLNEVQDVSMMLAWVYHFLALEDSKYSDLAKKQLDVTACYRKATRRFELTGCIRSWNHRTVCREELLSKWPFIANPLIAPL